jgi:putative inorganic carbon (HCO3(-)) transporter
MYLNIAAEIGIPGVIVFLAILWGHVRSAFRLVNTAANRWIRGFMLGMLAALIGIIVDGFTDYVLFNIQMSMIFWLLNAFIVVCIHIEAKGIKLRKYF